MQRQPDKIKLIAGFNIIILFIIAFAIISSETNLFSFSKSPQLLESIPELSRNTNYKINNTFLLSLIPYFAAIVILSMVFFRLAYFLYQTKVSHKNIAEEEMESGSSVMEFLLALPLLLMLLLTILQIALIVQAKFIVNYAAFCAVRSGIVVIPARVGSKNGETFPEARNQIYANDLNKSAKMQIIRRAAAFPCLAISPKMSSGLITSTGTFPDAYFDESFLTAKLIIFSPNQEYAKQIALRWGYAYYKENTKIEVLDSTGKVSTSYHDNGHITVKVTHRYYLTVPFANRLLGTSYFGGIFSSFVTAAYYIPITEQYTLLNEGEPSFPDGQKERFEKYDLVF